MLSVRILIQSLQRTSSFVLLLNRLAKHTSLLESANETMRIHSKRSLITAMNKKMVENGPFYEYMPQVQRKMYTYKHYIIRMYNIKICML